MFTENPVFGVGLGSFYRRFLDYKVPDARFPKNYIRGSESGMEAHSTYLQFLAETGVPGLLLFLALNFAVLRQVAMLVTRRGGRFERGLAIGLAAAFAALMVQNAFNSQEYLKVFWVVIALVAGAAECAREADPVRSPQPIPDTQAGKGNQEVVEAAG
jgi:O-antigen ligase